MEQFLVQHDNINGIAKDPHPLQLPNLLKVKDKETYMKLMKEWLEIDATLKRYTISKLVCDSGIKVDANFISFYPYENRNALLLEDGTVEIYSIQQKTKNK